MTSPPANPDSRDPASQIDPFESVGFHPAALLAAICIPGLGHIVRGEKKRGILAMVGILGLFFSGMFIAGLDAVDRRTEFWWFVPQAGVGPITFGVDYIKRERFLVKAPMGATGGTVYRPANPDETRGPAGNPVPLPAGARPPYIKAMGKSYEIGILYCALAGMTNLIVIIDAGFPTRRPGPKKPAKTAEAAA